VARPGPGDTAGKGASAMSAKASESLKRRVLVCAVAGVLGVLLALTPEAFADETTGQTGKTVLKIGWMGEVDNMNPLIGWSNNVYEVYANEYLMLTGRSWEEEKPDDKGINKNWTISDDQLVWTFTINEGMTWHDGTPITAADAVFTYNFILENEISSYIGFLEGVVKAELVDDTTYKVVCSRPKANLTMLWIPCLPEHIWGKMSAEEASSTFQNDPPVIGSGPFQVVEWKKDRYLRMAAYKDFYLGAPTVDELVFVVYKNGDTLVQDLKSGAIDAAYLFPPAQFAELQETPGIEATEYTWYNWDYIGFNCYEGKSLGNPVLRDKEFRAALEHAVDRQKLVDVAYAGHAWVGHTFMPPDNWRDPDYAWAPAGNEARGFDLALANQTLDDAGYGDSDGDGVREDKNGKPIKLRLWGVSEVPETERATKLIAGWWESVGIDVVLTVQDEGVYFDKIWNYEGDTYAPDFDAYYWNWDGYADPGQTLDCWTTGQIEGWNEQGWSNEEFDRLNEAQNQAMDPDERADLIHQMQQVMYEDCPVIVTTYPLKLQAYRTDTWSGWTRCNYGQGPAFCAATNPWAYYSLRPQAAEVAAGGTNVGLWVGVGVGVVVVAGVAALIIARRRKAGPEEEV
jgi:peptide/nickel transport system substrate-binding protein